MLFKDKVLKFLSNNWIVAGILLAAFLITNRYIYGWDDQHLEIPLLKHLIDPSLFAGDYYVESLKNNFTSIFYPILAKLIKVDQIPAVYLMLFLVSRYFLFYWSFRLWEKISGERFIAFACTAVIFLVGRPEDFIFRTLSHTEFSFIFVFSGLYYFYSGRYIVASILFGFAANFHAIYALFPMMYMGSFLLLCGQKRQERWVLILKTSLGFLIAALPFIIWTVIRLVKTHIYSPNPQAFENWIELYLLACPQNFLFGTTPASEVFSSWKLILLNFRSYIFLATVYGFNFLFNKSFREDKRIHATALMAVTLMVVSYVFTYIYPSRFVLDLNLFRNEQFVRYFLIGYTTIAVFYLARQNVIQGALAGIVFCFLGGQNSLDTVLVCCITVLFLVAQISRNNYPAGRIIARLALVIFYALIAFVVCKFGAVALPHGPKAVALWIILALLIVWTAAYYLIKNEEWRRFAPGGFVAIVLSGMFIYYCYHHYLYLQMTRQSGGFWQLQRNWEEMQLYARDHTPKEAMFLTPYDMEMGGFRIHSNRKVICCYRDCGIIGFDYAAAVEWRKRMQDIEPFKVFIKEPFTNAILNGIVKYKADYIVFMKYAAPAENGFLKKIYENETFSLYEVVRNQ